jgi:hypothetical protein
LKNQDNSISHVSAAAAGGLVGAGEQADELVSDPVGKGEPGRKRPGRA